MLAKLADKILFVVKWGSTTRVVAQAGHSLLAAANTADKILGAVVTQVDLKRHARGHYGGPPEYLQRHGAHLAIPKAAQTLPGAPTDIQRAWRRPAIGLFGACLIAGVGAAGFLYQSGAADHVDMTNAAATGTGDTVPVDQFAQRREIETQMAAALDAASEAARTKEAAEQTAATAHQTLQEEQARAEALARDLDAARREIEAQAATARTASEEAAHAKGAAERSAIELGQALNQEHDKGEALAGELATARRELQTQAAALAKAVGDQTAHDQQLGELRKTLRKAETAATAYHESLAQESARNQKLEQQLSRREATPERQGQATARLSESPATTPSPAPDKAATDSLPASDKPLMAAALTHDSPATFPSRPAAPDATANPEAVRLVARAGQLLIEGNVGAARLVLDRAAEMGSAQALFALAETYDPLSLSAWGTLGTQGDAAKAQELYAKALAGGVQGAKDRLNALPQ